MPDVARFFVWRLGGPEGRAVAASSVLVHDGRLHDNYLGLDYTLAHERHLYHVTLRDVFDWAVRNGVRRLPGVQPERLGRGRRLCGRERGEEQGEGGHRDVSQGEAGAAAGRGPA